MEFPNKKVLVVGVYGVRLYGVLQYIDGNVLLISDFSDACSATLRVRWRASNNGDAEPPALRERGCDSGAWVSAGVAPERAVSVDADGAGAVVRAELLRTSARQADGRCRVAAEQPSQRPRAERPGSAFLRHRRLGLRRMRLIDHLLLDRLHGDGV